ncbi:MAG: GAF domain-containing protein [Anaerolineales bacterium]|nr:GAF domain-containing protein [Anaerolineales bacterium]
MSITPHQKPSRSIRTGALLALSALLILSILLVAIISVSALNRAGRDAQQASSAVLRGQIETFLLDSTSATARQNDLFLEQIQQNANYIAYIASDVLSQPEVYSETVTWRAEERMFLGADGQFINSPEDVSSVYVPAFAEIDADLLQQINLTSYLDFIFQAIFENNDEIIAIYIGTTGEVTRYYPNVDLGSVLPPDFQVTQRPWYLSAITDNPARGVIWSPIYEDATGQGLLVTASAPIYDQQGEFYGVVGIDISIDEIVASVGSTQVSDNGYSFLMDESGLAIVLPEIGYQQILGRAPEPDEYAPALESPDPQITAVLERMLAQQTGFESVLISGQEYFITYAPMVNTRWSLANVAPASELLGAVSRLEQELSQSARNLAITRIIPAGILILAVAIGVGYYTTRRLIQPLQALVQAVQRIGSGDWETSLPAPQNNEIGILTQAFQDMTGRVRTNVQELEQRVAERTASLERRAIQLQTAAEVGRFAATLRDLDELLNEVTHLISNRFGYYHVGIFLLDQAGEYAVLQAANSAGGKRMLDRHHRLKVGAEGIVGFVTRQRTPRIALDVGQDAVFFDNPDLPQTRSEMALPLEAGERLLGALDVQSVEAAAFAEDDIAVLQVLADQVAVAIENAYLFQESQEALDAAQRAYGELSRQAWQEFLQAKQELGFASTSDRDLATALPEWSQAMKQASQTGQMVRADERTIAIPIVLRDEVLGVVRLVKPVQAGRWSDDEVELMDTLVSQLELALESARLYSDTQRQAERERLTAELADKIHRSLSIDALMQTLIDELGSVLGASSTFIQLGVPETGGNSQTAAPQE